MFDRSVKSNRILTKLCALDSEYIFEKRQNFVRKYALTEELLIFKYQRQNMPVSITLIKTTTGLIVTCWQAKASILRARETVPLLIRETSDFIAPTHWPANSSDLKPVDYGGLGKLHDRV